MKSFSRTALTALLAGAVLLFAAPPATAAPAALSVSPSVVHPGDSVTVTITCEPTDLLAEVRLRGNGVDVDATVPLLLGRAKLTKPVPDHTPLGRYRVKLTCKSSGATAAATVTVKR